MSKTINIALKNAKKTPKNLLFYPINELYKQIIKIVNKNKKWRNRDNKAFYESLSCEQLRKIAEKGGLASGCDIALLKEYWQDAHSILDVGAGYGRAIEALLNQGYQGKITAIERNPNYFNYLNKQYQNNNDVNILCADIKEIDQHTFDHEHSTVKKNNAQENTAPKFDLILFLWSGLADFSKEEQPEVIKKLAGLLNPGGKLVIDTFSNEILPFGAERITDQYYKFSYNKIYAFIYEPFSKDIEEYSKLSPIQNVQHIYYTTFKDRKRWLHILS